ncbi:membrane protein [Pandoraea pnomenusa 3kgm]|uniref:alpha/beta hydrolase n=1 Tax=Pandoraea pnomenusa TaxID=93220 RepID=UPI00040A2974|nr:alpha/beta hydrolase [Pandoraea pnomenusa]AHB07342.2 membrane protein [Pandoraea pnomenusa 3kgm]
MQANVRGRVWKWSKRGLVALLLVLGTLLALRIYDTQRGPGLSLWHTYVPPDWHAAQIDHATWGAYLDHENALFDDVREHVSDQLPPDERVASNRFNPRSAIYPEHFKQDWNRSYMLMPQGTPRGVVVLLHGLTDSPYSLRHIGRRYRRDGFAVVAIRLPGHGTVPAGLTDATWEDWRAATRLAVREARALVPAPAPLHLVGFSNGGALAMQFALDALENDTLARPDRLVLISPMIGITRFARFAGLAALPAFLPPFAKAAWLGIVPEFNPFKYNSFPVNGARQSYALTQALQAQIARMSRQGVLDGALPPVLTFHSVLDFTVSTRAVVSALYEHLPANGSELVLFDINRSAKMTPFFRTAASDAMLRLLPSGRRSYRTTVITNAGNDSPDMVAQVTEPGSSETAARAIPFQYPPEIFSLSHVALPFPMSDTLYGLHPDEPENYGVHLGAMSVRGEVGFLVIGSDTFVRLSSNPFYPLMEQYIDGLTGAVSQQTASRP